MCSGRITSHISSTLFFMFFRSIFSFMLKIEYIIYHISVWKTKCLKIDFFRFAIKFWINGIVIQSVAAERIISGIFFDSMRREKKAILDIDYEPKIVRNLIKRRNNTLIGLLDFHTHKLVIIFVVFLTKWK